VERRKILDKLNVLSTTITHETKQWYRCSIEVNLEKNTEALALIGLTDNNGNYHFKGNGSGIYLWGAQIEFGTLMPYEKTKVNLLKRAADRSYNSHNNYLYIFMATGFLGLISFISFLGFLFKNALNNKNILKITFSLLLAFNFLTENILLRHWGLVFTAFMLLVLYSMNDKETLE